MAIPFNDNIRAEVNRPLDFKFGPFISVAEAKSIIPIEQRYHGLIFGVYADPGDLINSDVLFYYFLEDLETTKLVLTLSLQQVTEIGNSTDQDIVLKAFTIKSSTVNGSGFMEGNLFIVTQLPANPTGAGNMIVGALSGKDLTTGFENAVFGYLAGQDLSTGYQNTLIGTNAGANLTEGIHNTIVGWRALWNVVLGSQNVALGSQAGRYFGAATSALTEAQQSIFIGQLARALANNSVNEIVIGNNAIGHGSNSATIGNPDIDLSVLFGNVVVKDTSPTPKGAGDEADYSANKTDYSYVTKLMLTNATSPLELKSNKINNLDSPTAEQYINALALKSILEDLSAGEANQGTWNANTNTPTIVSSTGTQGHYYLVTVGGSTTIDGISSWVPGDEIFFNGTVWVKRPSFAIQSINGKSGSAVTLNQDEILDGITYKQYSQTEKTKLAGIETGADVTDSQNVGAAINASSEKTTPVDADKVPLTDSADSNLLKWFSWANLKATLKTYFDTLYNNYIHPNHSGDVTSVGDGSTTIGNGVVTNAKLANAPANTIKGNNTGSPGVVLDLTPAQVKVLLDLVGTNTGDQTITLTGDVTGSGGGVFTATIANNAVTNTKLADMAVNTIKGRITAGTGDPENLSAAQVRTIINVEEGADVTDAQNVGAAIVSAASKTNPVSGDSIGIIDSEDSNLLKEVPLSSLALLFANNFVRHDVSTQALDATRRQNARTNISVVEQAPQSVDVTGARIDNLSITSKFLVFTGVNATNITGITALGNGEMLNIYCDVTNGITILTQNANSTAENRFAFNLTLRQGTAATLFYYENRWRLWQSGAFIIKGNADEVRVTTSWIGSGGANMIRIFDGGTQTGSWNALGQITATLIAHNRSAEPTNSVRRDELHLNYPQTVETSGTINNLALNADTKLLSLTSATPVNLTGITGGEQGRSLRIEARSAAVTIVNNSNSSTSTNRFQIGSDFTIPAGFVAEFMYLQSAWRLSGIASLKQDTLVSGTNIKTVNGNSLLGSGNLTIVGVTVVSVPASPTAAGAVGQIAYDTNFQYTYVGDGVTHLWTRTPRDISSWTN